MIDTDERAYWRFKNQHENLGKFGEAVWSRVFTASGIRYIPLKDIMPSKDRGPMLQGSQHSLPDFEVSTGRRRAYVDSKCKHQSVMYVNARQVRHGINKTSHEDYLTISEFNRQKCALAVIELFDYAEQWSGTLLVQTLAVLGEPIRGFSNQAHMVYWPRVSFECLATGISPRDIYILQSDQTTVPASICDKLKAFMDRRGEPPMQARLFA